MIYLDYSATTPLSKEVLDKYYQDSISYVGNANSPHSIGIKCREAIKETTNSILSSLGLNDDYEVIYTSGSTEANNLVIKGILNKAKESANVITTSFEHPSVVAPISYYQKKGITVNIVNVDKNGIVDLEHLKSLINDKTVLISIVSVNSEIGIKQPIEKIRDIVKNYPNLYFHSDITQSVGKVKLDLQGIDMVSFSAHKIYAPKGIGALVKKKSVSLECQILGGKSTTKYRSGTPMHPLIMSLGYALKLATLNLEEHMKIVHELSLYLKNELNKIPNTHINSNEYCIDQILNVSFINKDSLEIVSYLDKHDIFISNHSACSSEKNLSLAVKALTNDDALAQSSVRISLSHLTTIEELKIFIDTIKEIM